AARGVRRDAPGLRVGPRQLGTRPRSLELARWPLRTRAFRLCLARRPVEPQRPQLGVGARQLAAARRDRDPRTRSLIGVRCEARIPRRAPRGGAQGFAMIVVISSSISSGALVDAVLRGARARGSSTISLVASR